MTMFQPQTSLDERVVEHEELELALEHRQALKEQASAARKSYAQADEQAKTVVAELDLSAGPVRVGRFVLTLRDVEAREVAFETEPRKQLTIRVDREQT